jgi:hypothetical protein
VRPRYDRGAHNNCTTNNYDANDNCTGNNNRTSNNSSHHRPGNHSEEANL